MEDGDLVAGRHRVARWIASGGMGKRYRWTTAGELVAAPVFAYRVVDGRIRYVGPAAG